MNLRAVIKNWMKILDANLKIYKNKASKLLVFLVFNQILSINTDIKINLILETFLTIFFIV